MVMRTNDTGTTKSAWTIGNSKVATIDASGLTAARTVTLPDASGTATLLGNTSTGSGGVVLSGSPALTGTATLVNATLSGDLAVNGNTTLGDASGDAITFNAGTLNLPAVGGLTVNKPAESSTAEILQSWKVSDSLSSFAVKNGTANASEFAPVFEGIIESGKSSTALSMFATKGDNTTTNPAFLVLVRYNSGSGNTDLPDGAAAFEVRNRATSMFYVYGNGDVVLVKPGAKLGYGTGAGGIVTQATSRTTGVTLNKSTGAITTDTTSLAAGSVATFTVTNSVVSATDTVIVSVKSGTTTAQTDVKVSAVSAGGFNVTVANRHATTAETGAIVINFAIIKGVTS